jgi:hypothetical protein
MTRASAGLTLALLLSGTAALAAGEPVTVVELFTSQGCSSCPPADAFLGELSVRGDVLALSEHVDYWDYLGWKDPFASRENTLRQRAYAKRLGLGYVYTPQMVVQGGGHASGADRPGVLRLIAEAGEAPQVAVSVDRVGDDEWVVRLTPTVVSAAADVWLVRFDPRQITQVAYGENGGRRMENHNVVRGFVKLATWRGEAASMPIAPRTGEGCAILVQQSETGRILGAARCAAPAE